MADQTTRGELEHDQAVSLARRRARKQLDALAARCPGHMITVETYPGREDRYVARAVTSSARPYLLITSDLDELATELGGRGEHSPATPQPRRPGAGAGGGPGGRR